VTSGQNALDRIAPRPVQSPSRAVAPASLMWVVDALSDGNVNGAGDEYVLIPGAKRPRALLPANRARIGAQALRQYSNATRLKTRTGAELLALALRSGLPWVAPTLRLPGTLAQTPTLGSLAALLAEVTGVDHPVLTVSLGASRPQAKPVIQVLAPDGRLIAHAKVGWNQVTKPLVVNEHHMLAHVHRASPRTFRVPSILFAGDWNGRKLLVVRHGGSRSWFRPVDLRIPGAATRELSRLDDQPPTPLLRTRFWHQLDDRVTRVAGAGGGLSEALTTASSRIVDRYAESTLSLGVTHGDWAPWNMASLGSELLVWDWERASERGPLGMDALFFLLQTDIWIRGQEPLSSFEKLRRTAGPLLRALGLRAQDPSVLIALLALEMAVRQEEGAAAGVRVPARVYGAMRHVVSLVDDRISS
jgi:hypothetical protein